MRKKSLLEVHNDSLIYKENLKTSLIGKVIRFGKQEELNIEVKSIDDIKVDFSNKNIFIVVDGEEIYVKLMSFPKVNKERLKRIIKDELEYRFKNIENIMFTYQIMKDNGLSLEVMVFCMNWNKSEIIKKFKSKGGKVKGIFPIQFCFFDKYKNVIKDNNYSLIFIHKETLYFLNCYDNKITANNVVRNFVKDSFIDELNKFKDKCLLSNQFDNTNKIYFVDFPYKDIINKLEKVYYCEDLGNSNCDISNIL